MYSKVKYYYGSLLGHGAWGIAVFLSEYRLELEGMLGYILWGVNFICGFFALVYFYMNPKAFFFLSTNNCSEGFLLEKMSVKILFFVLAWIYVVVCVLVFLLFMPMLPRHVASYYFLLEVVTVRLLAPYLSLRRG